MSGRPLVLLPAEPFAGRRVDEAYGTEGAAAEHAGLTTAPLNFEALLDGDARRALRWVPAAQGITPALFRGWMMRPEVYTRLYAALLEKGWTLINTPAQYRHAHHLPESFAAIAHASPRTVWLPAETPADLTEQNLRAALATFGHAPLIVKDYVKSRKHEWDEACFIQGASGTVQALHVIQTFLARQGGEFQGGLVLREFEVFAPLGPHARSGMPRTREYRLFFADGEVLSVSEYWEDSQYAGEAPPLDLFRATAQAVQSRFFSMDVAQRLDGVWRVMELGDGQVAGLPERLDRAAFYTKLAGVLDPNNRPQDGLPGA